MKYFELKNNDLNKISGGKKSYSYIPFQTKGNSFLSGLKFNFHL